MKTILKSAKLANVCYDIRGPIMDRARQMEEEGQKIIRECGLPIMTADSLMEACEKSVKLARGELVH